MKREQALAIRRKIERAAESQSDENALDSIELFQHWGDLIGTQVQSGKRVQDGGKLYECIQSHTPQVGWNPSLTPALWKEVSIEEIPAWRQPVGSADAYMTGDKVKHNGIIWKSKVDNNVWEPGVVADNIWHDTTND